MKKLVKPKKQKKSYYQKKCDKRIQEIGSKVWQRCEVCGCKMSVLHHFFPKSSHSHLRYYWNNLVPLCHSCHFKHHTKYEPSIHAKVIQLRGDDWYKELLAEDRKYRKMDIGFYKDKLRELEIL